MKTESVFELEKVLQGVLTSCLQNKKQLAMTSILSQNYKI